MQSTAKSFVKLLVVSFVMFSSVATGRAADSMAVAGDVTTAVVAVAAGGMTLMQNDREGMVQLVKSAALDLAVTYGLKFSVHERRPNGEDNQSFPSAHTSVAFTSAEYLRKRYGWVYGIPAYGLASFVAYSRVESDKHYAKDVIAGAAIGIASSYIFTTPNLNFKVSAEAVHGYYGIKLAKAW